MRRVIPVLLPVVLLIAADTPSKEAKKELDRLQGTWSLVAAEAQGKQLPAEKTKNWKLTIKGNKYTFQPGKESIEGTYRLDPSQDPKAIDATRTNGPDKGKILLGIYELKDDTLKMCFGAPGEKKRPKTFATREGGKERLFVLKRGKP